MSAQSISIPINDGLLFKKDGRITFYFTVKVRDHNEVVRSSLSFGRLNLRRPECCKPFGVEEELVPEQ